MRLARGFTLIEVLVALLVFGLIASIAAKSGSQYILTYERVRDKTFAAWIADNRINELRLQEKLPPLSETTRDIQYGPSEWQVVTLVVGTADPTIRRVEVSVGKYAGTGEVAGQSHSLAAFVGDK